MQTPVWSKNSSWSLPDGRSCFTQLRDHDPAERSRNLIRESPGCADFSRTGTCGRKGIGHVQVLGAGALTALESACSKLAVSGVSTRSEHYLLKMCVLRNSLWNFPCGSYFLLNWIKSGNF